MTDRLPDCVPGLADGSAHGTEAIGLALAAARERGRDAIVVSTVELPDPPDLLGVFERAESERARRFYATSPARGIEIVGVGCIAEARADTPRELSSLRERCEALLERVIALEPADERVVALEPRDDRSVAAKPPDALAEAPCSPLLLGGMAFEARDRAGRASHWAPFGSASFALPELLLMRNGGRTWLSRAVALATVDRDPLPREAAIAARLAAASRWLGKPPPAPVPARALALCPDRRLRDRYRNDVARVVAAIRRGEAYKVVLAAEEVHAPTAAVHTADVLRAFAQQQPQSLTYAQGIADHTFLGASFERLVSLRGTELRTAAIAGTVPRDDAPADAPSHPLARSSKDRSEQAIVVEQIRRALAEVCASVAMDESPEILAAGAFHHLHTSFRATLARPIHVLDVAGRLHPTPALGGHPHRAALTLIHRHERFDRGWYGGPIGWVDARGDGELFVALRCALSEPKALRIFAGSGLMSDSDPDREARETGQKLAAIRRALEPRA